MEQQLTIALIPEKFWSKKSMWPKNKRHSTVLFDSARRIGLMKPVGKSLI